MRLSGRFFTLLFLAFSALLAGLSYGGATSRICTDGDYVVQAQATCMNGHRAGVLKLKSGANCTEVNSGEKPVTVGCECQPSELVATYSDSLDGPDCTLTFSPKPGNTCIVSTPSLTVPAEVCMQSSKRACGEEDIQYVYGACDHSKDPPLMTGIPYFDPDANCNPHNYGSIGLPDARSTPCDIDCAPGTFMAESTCVECPMGTYSLGGVLDILGSRPTDWSEMESSGVLTSCSYKEYGNNGNLEAKSCSGWRLEGGSLVVGPYDQINHHYSNECRDNPSYNCVNNVNSELRLDVFLLKDGDVTFEYEVDAEKNYDGLIFFVDGEVYPKMPLKSFTDNPRTKTYFLTKGRHALSWIYRKDAGFTAGKDQAWLRSIHVSGTDFHSTKCTPCPHGTTTTSIGSPECTACTSTQIWAVNATSTVHGAGFCQECPDGLHSEDGTTCTAPPVCGIEDTVASYKPCHNGRRKIVYSWKRDLQCAPGTLPAAVEEDCPPCPAGYTRPSSEDCRPCASGSYSDGSTESKSCDEGSAAIPAILAQRFDTQSILPHPLHVTTRCGGDSCADRLISNVTELVFDPQDDYVSMRFDITVVSNGGKMTLEFDNQYYHYKSNLDVRIDDTLKYHSYLDYSNKLTYTLDSGAQTIEIKFTKPLAMFREVPRIFKLNEIRIDGAIEGGAVSCTPAPPGAIAPSGAADFSLCEAGTFSLGGVGECTKCPFNTYSGTIGAAECDLCYPGTSSNEGATSCFIGGDVNDTGSFCTFRFEDESQSDIFYDLQPLSDANNGTGVFGPVLVSPHASRTEKIYLGMCQSIDDTEICEDFSGNAVTGYACVQSKYTSIRTGRPFANSLGQDVSFHELEYGNIRQGLEKGKLFTHMGLQMSVLGSTCFGDADRHVLNVTLLCDPDAGMGMPAAWDAYTSYSLSTGEMPKKSMASKAPLLTIKQSACESNLLWYSAHACRVCTREDDVERVDVYGCPDRIKSTYRIKEGSACVPPREVYGSIIPFPVFCADCQESDYERISLDGCPDGLKAEYAWKLPKVCYGGVLPEREMCLPCTASDIIVVEESCLDGFGNNNKTVFWNPEAQCSHVHENTIPLPESRVAGPCLVAPDAPPDNPLTDTHVILGIVAGSLVIILLTILTVRSCLKNRRLYAQYAKLVEEEGGVASFEMTGEEDFDSDL